MIKLGTPRYQQFKNQHTKTQIMIAQKQHIVLTQTEKENPMTIDKFNVLLQQSTVNALLILISLANKLQEILTRVDN